MGQENVYIVGGTKFVASVESISLRSAGHRVADGGRDLESARKTLDVAIEAGASVALLNYMDGEEEVFAKEIKKRAPEIVVVTFSYRSQEEVGFGDLHVQRHGGPPDWEGLPKAISTIRRQKTVNKSPSNLRGR